MTNEELTVIQNVCKMLCCKYKFQGYEPDDIYQESFLICIELMKKYDGSSPLSNFLIISLKNRLINLRRKNMPYYKFKCDKCCNKDYENCSECLKNRVTYTVKRNIFSPIDIDEVAEEILYQQNYNESEKEEVLSLIDIHLPIHMREDYLKMSAGVSVTKFRRDEIVNRIRDILKQNDYIDEDLYAKW